MGASGRRYSRNYVLNMLEERFQQDQSGDIWETGDFYCKHLGADVYLLTYTYCSTGHAKRADPRSGSKPTEGWKIVYHQGTIVEDA